MSLAGDENTVPETADTEARCRRCGHLLTAAASVERGVGPICRHREHADALAVVA